MDPFIGEIRMFTLGYAPIHWAYCDGANLLIREHAALYSLLKYYYGPVSESHFHLPDLRGRSPMSFGDTEFSRSFSLGDSDGYETTTLSKKQLPLHTHKFQATSTKAADEDPTNKVLGTFDDRKSFYFRPDITDDDTELTDFSSLVVESMGEGQPHENMQPFSTTNFIIALIGQYPSRL